MRWFVKTASAAMLSLFLVGSASAAPDALVSFTVRSGLPQGSSTTFNIQSDGSYTVQTDGGMAHFIAIRAQGKLTDAQLKSIEAALTKAAAEKPASNLPGRVPGSEEFTVTWNGQSVSGSTNTKGAIEDAKSRGLDVSDWKVMSALEGKLNSLETKVVADYKPALPAPDKKSTFDEISIQERNTWTGGVDKLTVKADGSYTLERSLGQSTLTGTLSTEQMNAINKAYDTGVVAANDGKMVGGLVPDDTMFTISATEGGKTYSVNGSVDSQNLGDLAKLEHALVGDVNSVQPPVAKPIDKTATDDGVTDAIKARGAATGPRTGMDAVIEKRAEDGADKPGEKAGDK